MLYLFLKHFQSSEDFAADILDDLYLNITTINLLKPGELKNDDITSDVMSYAIIRDSLGIVNDARVELKRKGDSLSGPLLGKTLKRVSYVIMRDSLGILWGFSGDSLDIGMS